MLFFLKTKKLPNKAQWSRFFKILSKPEKIAFISLFILALASSSFLLRSFYVKNTKVVAAAGGTYVEGVVGRPRFINPIYANSDADRDLVQLIFSGLMKYNDKMEIVPDLAEKYEISQDKKTYTFYLRKNIFWQDKRPLNADDIIFTIKSIQDNDAKSPLRANWIGVKAEKIDDLTVRFRLEKPYSAFLENCTLKIVPKHIWEKISTKNFLLANELNLHPIGSGAYKIEDLVSDKDGNIKSVVLVKNNFYFGKEPNISKIKFLFFGNEKELIKAAKSKKIDGLSLSSFVRLGSSWKNYFLAFPRYFAVFLNQEKAEALTDKNVRLALNYATNKKEIVKKITSSGLLEEQICHSPILPKIYGFKEPEETYNFNPQKAKDILDKAGFKENNGIRERIINKKRN